MIRNPGRALDYRNAIDSFVTRNRDLHQCELSEGDWTSITLVSSWLKSFRSATTQMSTTNFQMLSKTHAIFRVRSGRSYEIFLRVFLRVLSRGSSMRTQKSVITIISTMNFLSILGLLVSNLFCSNLVVLTVF